jgi:hypothetical protein
VSCCHIRDPGSQNEGEKLKGKSASTRKSSSRTILGFLSGSASSFLEQITHDNFVPHEKDDAAPSFIIPL